MGERAGRGGLAARFAMNVQFEIDESGDHRTVGFLNDVGGGSSFRRQAANFPNNLLDSIRSTNAFFVLRALGLLEKAVDAIDPLETDLGRLRAGRLAKKRAR